ncbi:MAG TPA: hypothetical protein VJP77_09905 [Planctomycetota bacterium]|nr:hypothetical protein [Planctomycetota bacterium]
MSADLLYSSGGGVFRGPTPAPLGGGLARALGSQGGAVPGFSATPGMVSPVFIVGDTSESLSRALAVRRGWQAQRTAVAAANVFRLALRGYASAGCVIEHLRVAAVPPAALVTPFNVLSTVPTFALPGLAIGGTSLNDFIGGIGEGVHFTQSLPVGPTTGLLPHPAVFDPLPFRIFIPPGEAFAFETADVGVDVDWSIVWREVPE